MTSTLILLLFTQSEIFPEDTAHWALYFPGSGGKGTLFHVAKQSLVSCKTQLDERRNFNPTTAPSMRSAVSLNLCANISVARLRAICQAVSKKRPFDLLVNNCQRWVTQVLERLVVERFLEQSELYSLQNKGFSPLIG